MTSRPPRFQGSRRPQTIDEVIAALEALVAWSYAENLRHGYFGQVYLAVTREVGRGLKRGAFTTPALLERLDVVFALRYIDAFDAWVVGAPVGASWKVALEADRDHKLMALQHVLLGMNAHINLDLAVATAEVAPGAAIETIKADFMGINNLLGGMIDGVEAAIGATNPLIAAGDELIGDADERAIDFSMRRARDAAWEMATELAATPRAALPERIAEHDRRVSKLARLVVGNRLTRALTRPLVALERLEPREVIDRLRTL